MDFKLALKLKKTYLETLFNTLSTCLNASMLELAL